MTESTTNLRKNRKYAILDHLRQLSLSDYKTAMNNLPSELGVSKRTFERYMYAFEDDRLQVSADKLAIIANFLGCNIEDLINYEVKKLRMTDLRKVVKKKLKTEYNLKRKS